MINRLNITYIYVENEKLKIHPYAYNIALNHIDHMTWRHSPKSIYKWKYVTELTDVDILSCETEYALVIKIGTYFNTTVMHQNLPDDASLVGHILDKGSEYYELHDQCFLVRVSDYDSTPNKTFRKVSRSEENFHGDYTPIEVWDGGEELDINPKKIRNGAHVISNMLRKGKTIKTFSERIRQDKFYIYPHDISVKLQKVYNRSHKIFPVATERFREIDRTKYDNLVGCANGLQLLHYAHVNTKNIYVYDINPESLKFTEELIWRWDPDRYTYNQLVEKYQDSHVSVNMTPNDYFLKYITEDQEDLFEIIKLIRNSKINIHMMLGNMIDSEAIINSSNLKEPKTLLYLSNVMTYSKTFHCISAIDADLIFLNYLNKIHESSVIVADLPYRGYGATFTKKDMTFNNKLNLPWRKNLFQYYTKTMKDKYGIVPD